MSQPAVSNALRRARKLTQDQLFLKVADGVQPTARMLAIWPELHRSLAVIRASARIAFSVHTNAGSLDGIERGTLDCAVGMFPALPRVIHVQSLRTDHYVCVMQRGHKLSREMTLEQFAAASHVVATRQARTWAWSTGGSA
jgi:DNA-binding transcriptional LysR family regulator